MIGVRVSPTVNRQKRKGKSFFVSANGNDSNDGRSPSTPWQTITKVNNYVANTGLGKGDRIRFIGTVASTTGLYIDNAKTTAFKQPYTLESYGAKATLSFTGSGVIGVLSFNLVVRLKNLVVKHNDYTTAGDGIQLFGGVLDREYANLQVINCEVEGFDRGILGYCYTGNARFNSLLIQGTKVSKCKRVAITVNSQANYINQRLITRYCTIQQIYGNSSTEDGGVGNGIILGECQNSLIEYCFADGAESTQGVANNLLWFYKAKNCTIRNNIAINGNGLAQESDRGGLGLDIYCDDCLIENNFVYNCKGEGVFLGNGNNNTIRNNLFIDCCTDPRDGQHGVLLLFGDATTLPPTNIKIYNNTVVNRTRIPTANASVPSAAVFIRKANTTGIIANNILWSNTPGNENILGFVGVPNIRFYGNAYYSANGTPQFRTNNTTYSGLSAWRTGTGQESLTGTNYGQEANPLFANSAGSNPDDFRLQSGSPLGSGLDLPALFAINPGTRDYFRNSIASVIPGIGADSSRSVTQYATPNELTQLLNTSLAYWRLDASPWTEAKGISSYSLGTAGTIATGTALSTGSTNSASISDATSNLNLSDTSLLHLPDECTVILTFQKTLAAATNGTATLIGKWDAGANQRGWHVQLDYPSGQATSERLQFQHTTNGQSGTQVTLSSGFVTPRNTKRLLIFQRSVSNNFLRVSLDNGTFASATNPASIHQSTARFAIGGRYNSGAAAGGFTGLIDNVGIWSYILTSSQLTQFWNSGNFRQL